MNYTIDPKIHCTFEMITPQMAEDWLRKNISNRPLSQTTINKFVGAITRGEWMLNGETICFDYKGNLVNGQHRLKAIVKSGIAVPIAVMWNIPDGAFATYDSGKARTAAEVLAVKGYANYAKQAAMVRKVKSLENDGKNIISGNSTTGRIVLTNQQILSEYESNKERYDSALNISKEYINETSKFLTHAELGAIVYHLHYNLNHSFEKIKNFFDGVYFGGKEKNRATELRKYLISNNENRTRKLQSSIKGQIVIRAWNFYISNNNKTALMPKQGEDKQFFK